MKIDGSCHCGSLIYEAEVSPEHVYICHCTDCQLLGGSAFRIRVLSQESAFRFTRGNPSIYEKLTERGDKRAQAFCGTCGTSICGFGSSEESPLSINAASCSQRNELVPKLQVWCRSALSWVDDIGSIPKHHEQPAVPRSGK